MQQQQHRIGGVSGVGCHTSAGSPGSVAVNITTTPAITGAVRRACPASGAQWNVQVVRGKMTGRCLWNACKALSLGLLLMVLGAAMATIGYYANHLSVAQVVRGNHTIKVKNESRGFHLNNLSYAGPIVMGIGGFIVVAACVMTFEARDSAAKVVPARFKSTTSSGYHPHRRTGSGPAGGSGAAGRGSSRRSACSQTLGGPQSTLATPGAVRPNSPGLGGASSGGGGPGAGGGSTAAGSPNSAKEQHTPGDRRAMTAALQQFSREMTMACTVGAKRLSPSISPNINQLSVPKTSLSRSPSAPLLYPQDQSPPMASTPQPMHVPGGGVTSPPIGGTPRSVSRIRHHHHHHGHNHPTAAMVPRGTGRPGAYSLLSPAGLLKRHAVSVDESAPYRCSNESLHGSQTSMQMDLHVPNDYPITLRVRDTARRRVLTRQRQVELEDEGHHATQQVPNVLTSISPGAIPRSHFHSRRNSNASDHARHKRRGPCLERAASTDARVADASTPVMMSLTCVGHKPVTTSQETVLQHRQQCCKGHKCGEFRKQRSYSPKGSSREKIIVEPLDEQDNGNRSN